MGLRLLTLNCASSCASPPARARRSSAGLLPYLREARDRLAGARRAESEEFLIFIVLGFLLMWLFVVLPQQRRIAAHERLVIESIKPGDEVVTAGGLYGDVLTEVGEDEIAMEIAPGVESTREAMRAIGAVIPPDAYEDEEDVFGGPARGASCPRRTGGGARGNREVLPTREAPG